MISKKLSTAYSLISTIALLLSSFAVADQHHVKITVSADKRCFNGNGLPDHDTGDFPNRGNPNSIQEQRVNLCLAATPRKRSSATMNHRGSVGIALNGVQLRPGTADYYDASSSRGFSRDPSSGWNLEGIGAAQLLGMDMNKAHVDKRGLYHYHAVAQLQKKAGQLLGYAADGFEIYYANASQQSSYQLHKGIRKTAPGGSYDGTYVQDWRYVARSGTLDQCNGGLRNGQFVYFATQGYPFFPRCFWGTVSPDFKRNSRANSDNERGPSRGKAPMQAIAACKGKGSGNSCRFNSPKGHSVLGVCQSLTAQGQVCVPKRRK